VSHNRCELLRRCLESVERSEGRQQIEIVVIDNGSSDGSEQLESEFPGARFLKLPRNFGLTKAMNIGARSATGEFTLFLHEDTEVEPTTIGMLAAALEGNQQAAVVCPLLVTPTEDPAPQFGKLPEPGHVDPQWRAREPGGAPELVEYPTGAALMVRSYLLKALRYVDERYGQFWSDAEICRQIQRAGRGILLFPAARVLHHGGRIPLAGLTGADYDLGAAAYLGKHFGFAARAKAWIGSVFSALGKMDFTRLQCVVTGQKIDGSQPGL
jgi:N-acetylglucosaminyl-diphospho-decaprenol L-rhamnosyltransferase